MAPGTSGPGSSSTLTITDTNGTELLAATAVDVYAGDTLASAAERQVNQLVLTTGEALVAGDIVRVTGDNFWEDIEVQSYDADTKTVTLRDRTDIAFPAGSTVAGRWMSYTLDASDTDTWAHLDTLVLIWTWNATDEPQREYAQIVKYKYDPGALQNKFRSRFLKYHELLQDGQWDDEVSTAYNTLRVKFLARGKNIDRLIDKYDIFDELILLLVAIHICLAGDDNDQIEYERLMGNFNQLFGDVAELPIWTDDDEDNIEEESETAPATRGLFRRQLW